MNTKIIPVVIGLLILAGVIVIARPKPGAPAPSDADKMSQEEGAMMEEKGEDGAMMEKENGDAMMEEKPGEAMSGESAMGKEPGDAMQKPAAGTYGDYSPQAVAEAQAAGRKVVLFFHAPWCPFCRAADAAFQAKLGQIPAGVTLLKTDYDSNVELRRRYGVSYQHTFVQIDGQGNELSMWNGGDVDGLVKYMR